MVAAIFYIHEKLEIFRLHWI